MAKDFHQQHLDGKVRINADKTKTKQRYKKRTLADHIKFRRILKKIWEQQRMKNFLITTFDMLMRDEISKF